MIKTSKGYLLYSPRMDRRDFRPKVWKQGIFEQLANNKNNIEVIQAKRRLHPKGTGYGYIPSMEYKQYIKKLVDKGIVEIVD